MNTARIEEFAQDIVNAIKPLVGNRTLNIMNVAGVIIASSDPQRVGSFHQGAARAAETRSVVRIGPEDLAEYPGAREGTNLPVVKNGEVLGVVGIDGLPDEVEQSANLLVACVDLYLDQAQSAKKSRMRKDLRLALVRRMLLGDTLDQDELLAGSRELALDLRLPMRAVMVTAERQVHTRSYGMEIMDRAYGLLNREGWIDENRDVFAVVDESLVIFQHIAPGFDCETFIEMVHQGLRTELGVDLGVAAGGLCHDWRQLVVSHREAQTLAEMYPGRPASLNAMPVKVSYLLGGCLRPKVTDRLLEPHYQTLVSTFGHRELERVMHTVDAFVEAGCRNGPAADRLGVHKNTVTYRLNKIVQLLGMEDEAPFVRELFLRLLLLHHRLHG